MSYFQYQHGELYVENISLKTIAEKFGTPCYVYSRAALETNWRAFDNAFGDIPHRICYAVKANSNIAILNIFSRLSSSFDIVSQGELERVLAAGGDPKKIVFSGVGKTTPELIRALAADIYCFNIESAEELERLNNLAQQANKTAAIALRVNPNIDAGTHPYIATGLKENKFGIEIDQAILLSKKIKTLSNINLIGIACHIGSQLTDLNPFLETADRLVELVNTLINDGIELQHIDIGGGLGISYHNEHPPSVESYVASICEKLRYCSLEIIIEPGRAIAATAGILLTRTEYLKHTPHKNFAIVDAGMNDLMRPALYQAWQPITTLTAANETEEELYDIVGPVCESADFLGKERKLALKSGELLAIHSVGAYGFSMSSNYNSRPRAAEVMVDGDKMHLIRPRETIEELFAQEKLIP